MSINEDNPLLNPKPGKYDDLCTKVREETKADLVFIGVISKEKGFGFSVQGTEGLTLMLPLLINQMSEQIAEDVLEKLNHMISEKMQ